jgi:hypothetical protein
MAISWGAYEAFDPGVSGPLHEQSRRDARAAFFRLMAAKADRIGELQRLLAANGVDLETSDSGLQALNDWFRLHVQGDETSHRLQPWWYAVVNDLALVLGDEMIARSAGLHWAVFDKGAKNAAYQRHVIMGFTNVPNPKYNCDIDLLLATYGHRIVAGSDVDVDAFVQWVRAAVSNA